MHVSCLQLDPAASLTWQLSTTAEGGVTGTCQDAEGQTNCLSGARGILSGRPFNVLCLILISVPLLGFRASHAGFVASHTISSTAPLLWST